MNTTLINDTNAKLNEIIERIKVLKEDYESKLAFNKGEIDKELVKVNQYKDQFYEAKKKIQKVTDEISGFEEDYRNLVEKFQDEDLANILTGVSKEINVKIREKKRSIQKDQKEMNDLIDKAQEAKKALIKLTQEKKALENVYNQVKDVYTYYNDEFERIAKFTTDNIENLHPDDDLDDMDKEDELVAEDIEIDEKEEIVTDEDVNKEVVEIKEDVQKDLELSNIIISDDLESDDEQTMNDFITSEYKPIDTDKY